ncbi:RNA-binding protein [Candidatus Shapirobacteria bacterium]|nr:RNA-binding protein [Candidatus Shapirobacteria bacterium]
MAKKLFVGNLSWNTTNDSLRDFFAQVGNVISASVITDRMSGRSRGFGFVEMEDADAEKAKKELNGKELDGRAISVNDARPQEESGGQGRGGYQNNRR